MVDKLTSSAVKILNKEYRIACEPEHEEALLRAARLLDTRMREIRDSGKVIGTDRIAVMAALNLAHELISDRSIDKKNTMPSKRIQAMKEKIESTLNETMQLDL
tara:strand:+ start:1020 stop:1331 length:312 start_codon:yes stop_codon:yes gene_type:complete